MATNSPPKRLTRTRTFYHPGRTLDVVEESERVSNQDFDWPVSSQDSKSESENESHVICCLPHGHCFVGKPLHLPNDYGIGVKGGEMETNMIVTENDMILSETRSDARRN